MLTMPLSTLLVAALLAAEPTAPRPPLHTAQEIRFLGREDADSGIPAVVRGVVTHLSAARKDLFLQDETAGIYVEPSGLLGACETGDEVEVTGTTRAGTFAPCLKPTKIVRLGKSRLPSPIVTNLTPFEARSLDAQYVETSGVLTRIEPRKDANILYVRNHLVRFVVRVEADAAPDRLAKLLNEPVRVRGVSLPDFNFARQTAGNSAVIFTGLDRVEPIHLVPAPIRSKSVYQHLYGFCPEIEPFTKRSLVRGVAVARLDSRLVVQDGTGGMIVFRPDDCDVRVGDEVETVGFLSIEGRQGVLHAQTIRTLGSPGLPEPKRIEVAAVGPSCLCQRVRFTARVGSRFDQIDGIRVVVRDGLARLEILLPEGIPPETRAALVPGALVEWTGVPVATDPFDGALDDRVVLHVVSAADLSLLEAAPPLPWWNSSRTWWTLGGLGSVAAMGLAVAAVQRRRLKRQTAQIAEAYENQARLEDSLRQHRKLEAVGRLAGGIAHDFNNLLTIICGNSEHVGGMLPAEHPAGGMVGEILDASRRGAALSRQLLTFSRQNQVSLAPMSLHTAVADLDRLIRRLVGDGIAVEIGSAAGLPDILGDRELIQQILLNLSANARDAMPGGGTITVSTSAHTAASPGGETRWARLTVADTGEGMTPEVQERIFEPFFTTREVGKGTGLGLATVYGIVQTLSGKIAVRSAPGRGSTFTIDLPATDLVAEPGSEFATPSPAPLPTKGTATILLVEDEDGVRNFCRRTLAIYGYEVTACASPAEALGLPAGPDGRLADLLITDLIMPGMNGHELAERLKSRSPGLLTIFMSGYAEEEVREIVGHLPGMGFIQKPFTTLQLVARVQDILEPGAGE